MLGRHGPMSTSAASLSFSSSSRQRLTLYDLGRFPSGSLFDRLARCVCRAGCLPRKELFEAWEVARRARRLFRGGRIVDLAAGHGLLALTMLLLDDSSPGGLAVDVTEPPSRAKVYDAIVADWPRLAGRVEHTTAAIPDVPLHAGDVVVSSHACGALTDVILDCASSARARLAVLPCCHDLESSDTGGLTGWLDGPLAVDVMRAERLRRRGYRVWTQTIPAAVTPKNRLLLGAPASAG
jgi:Methyltransferase domain